MAEKQKFVTQELEQHIKHELHSKRFFTIPNIGSIHLKREAAKFSEEKTILFPPYVHLQFSKSLPSNKNKNGKLQTELIELSNKITEELETHGKSKIKGIGIFQKENDKLNFFPDKDLEKSFSMDLEPLYGVSEVSKTFTESPSIVAETLIDTKPKTDFSSFKNYTKVIGWACLGIGLLYALFNIPINLSNDNTPIVKQKTLNPKISINIIDTTALIDSAHLVNEVSKENLHHNNTEIGARPKQSKTIVSKIPVVDKSNSNLPKIHAKVQHAKPDTNQISKVTGKPCAIITGSFKSAVYAVRMIKKLQKLGYKVYSEENDSTTRVGLLYNCKKVNEVDLLSKIKTQVEVNSWILE